jgi:hypothetical protein
MSSRHSRTSTRTLNGTSGNTHYKGSQRSRTQQQEPLDDQLTDWWSATVLGDNGSQCSLGWEYTTEELPMTSTIDDNPCVSDDESKRSLGWEYTMEELPMTSATGDNPCESDDPQFSLLSEFNMEVFRTTITDDNSCTKDDGKNNEKRDFLYDTSSHYQTKQSCQEQTGEN